MTLPEMAKFEFQIKKKHLCQGILFFRINSMNRSLSLVVIFSACNLSFSDKFSFFFWYGEANFTGGVF